MAKEKQTINDLPKFERTVLFTARAAELAKGATPKFDVKKEGLPMITTDDYVKIAQREFELDLLDLELYRD
jgi:DNA-directed RNA polymerase subunit K/omega